MKDLEAKLSALESSTHSLQSDNERLKLALQRARTENEILRATTGQHSPTSSRPVSASYPSPGSLLPDEDSREDERYNVQSLSNGSVVNAMHLQFERVAPGDSVVDIAQLGGWRAYQAFVADQARLADALGR